MVNDGWSVMVSDGWFMTAQVITMQLIRDKVMTVEQFVGS